jgi:hypothetical protein
MHYTCAYVPKGGQMMESSSQASQGQQTNIDTSIPNSARIWNYWLGGKDNYTADRMAGDQISEIFPDFARSARAERAFLVRAVRYLVNEAGIRQFLDIGSGLPTSNSTHQVAQSLASESRVVYVDNDPVVLVYAQALLTSSPEGATAYVHADIRDTDQVLRAAAEMALDFAKPVAIILPRILSFIANYDQAYAIVNRLLGAVPAGSFLVISHLASEADSETFNEAIRLWNRTATSPITPHGLDEMARFFEGLELVEPGIVRCSQWRPDSSDLPYIEVPEYGAVGRKAEKHLTGEESLGENSMSTSTGAGSGGRSETSEVGRLSSTVHAVASADSATPRRVFISHAHDDHELAQRINDALARSGIPTTTQVWQYSSFVDLAVQLRETIQASDVVVVLLSPAAGPIRWLGTESELALSRDVERRGAELIPVLAAPIDLPGTLRDRAMVDLTSDITAGVEHLVEQIQAASRVDFSAMSPYEFEELVADLLRSLGFHVDEVRRRPDPGVDLRATYQRADPFGSPETEVWLVQAKLYSHDRASVDAIRQLTGALAVTSGETRGLLVTNAQLTSVAREYIAELERTPHVRLKILDGVELKRLLRQFPGVTARHFHDDAAKPEPRPDADS